MHLLEDLDIVVALVNVRKRKAWANEATYQRIGELRQTLIELEGTVRELAAKLRKEKLKTQRVTEEIRARKN